MSSQQIPLDAEEFWDDLLAFIEDGRVIPLVGAELLTIEDGGQTISLYRAVAERLLSRYRLSADSLPGGAVLRENHELHDAVSALVATGKRVKELYRPTHDILEQLLATQEEPLPALRELAEITHFDLFVTATPDDLLARALDEVRSNGLPVAQLEYAPSLPTDRRNDLPELRQANYMAVFYLFGRADVFPLYAIHDEDVLEFAYTLQYTLQSGVPPARMFSELRSRNLLLIGCNFADWLSRFFLRLSNERRLSSDERLKKEFLVDRTLAEDQNLTVFLQRFSRDTCFYPMPAREFVAELNRRWKERNPPRARDESASNGNLPMLRTVPAGSGSVFISYAHEDSRAARRLFDELQEIGWDVVWFDKSALKPGDDWDRHIKSAIQHCALFLPLLSTTTEHKSEGYFLEEWDEAAQRSRRILGRKFILPIVIDPDFDGDLRRYQRVREEFKPFQYSHAPGGQLSPGLRDEITAQLRNFRRGRTP